MICAIILAVFGVFHMFTINFVTIQYFPGNFEQRLAYGMVMGRAKSLAYTAMLVAFLAVALYHGVYGLRSTVLESLASRPRLAEGAAWLIVAIGILALIYGTFVVILSYLMA